MKIKYKKENEVVLIYEEDFNLENLNSISYVHNKHEEKINEALNNETSITNNSSSVGSGKTSSTIRVALKKNKRVIYVADDYHKLYEQEIKYFDLIDVGEVLVLKSFYQFVKEKSKEFDMKIDPKNYKIWNTFKENVYEIQQEQLSIEDIPKKDITISTKDLKDLKKKYYKQFELLNEINFLLVTKQMFGVNQVTKLIRESFSLVIIYDERGIYDGLRIELKPYQKLDHDIERETDKLLSKIENKNDLVFFEKQQFYYKQIQRIINYINNLNDKSIFKYKIKKDVPDEVNIPELIKLNEQIYMKETNSYNNEFIELTNNLINGFAVYSFDDDFHYSPTLKFYDNSKPGMYNNKQWYEFLLKMYLGDTNKMTKFHYTKWIKGNYIKQLNDRCLKFNAILEGNYSESNKYIKDLAPSNSLVDGDFLIYIDELKYHLNKFYNEAKYLKGKLRKRDSDLHKLINLKQIYTNNKFIDNLVFHQDLLVYTYNDKEKNTKEKHLVFDYYVLTKMNSFANRHKIFILDGDYNKFICDRVIKRVFERPYLMNFVEKEKRPINNFNKTNLINIDVINKKTIILQCNKYNGKKTIFGKTSKAIENEADNLINQVIRPLKRKGYDLGLITFKDNLKLFKDELPKGRLFNFPAKGFNDLEKCDIVIVFGSLHYGPNYYMEEAYFKFENLKAYEGKHFYGFRKFMQDHYVGNESYQAIGRGRGSNKNTLFLICGFVNEKTKKLWSVVNLNTLNFEHIGKLTESNLKAINNKFIILDWDKNLYEEYKQAFNLTLKEQFPKIFGKRITENKLNLYLEKVNYELKLDKNIFHKNINFYYNLKEFNQKEKYKKEKEKKEIQNKK